MALADMTASRGWVESKIAELQSTLSASIAQKQNTLVAGSGVTIEGSVISATADLSTILAEITTLQAQMLGKQGTLTAGSGISIANGVISCTVTGEITSAYFESKIAELNAAIAGKQASFSVGEGLSLVGGVLSATGAGGGSIDTSGIENDITLLTERVNGKQDILSPGDGIEISGGIISFKASALEAYAKTADLTALSEDITAKFAEYQKVLSAGDNVTITENGVVSVSLPDMTQYVTLTNMSSSLSAISTSLSQYQRLLSAGTGIAIESNVVRCTLDLTPYAKSSDVNSEILSLRQELAGKQSSLVAGSGISIVNGVISSSVQVGEAVGELVTSPVSGRAVWSYLIANYTTSATLTSTLANYATSAQLASSLASYATQAYVLTQLQDYVKSTALTSAISGFKSEAEIRTIVTGYGYATQSSLTSLQTSLEQYVRSAVSGVQAGMTYKGTVAAVGNLPSSNVNSGDMYWVTGATSFYISNGTTWDVISLGSIDLTGYLSTSLFNAHVANSNAEKHVTQAQLDLLTSLASLQTQATTHMANTTIHVTSADKTAWDGVVSSFATHAANTVYHLTQSEHEALTALLAGSGSGSGSTISLLDWLSPTATGAVKSSAIHSAVAAKQDAIYTNLDLSATCKFGNSTGRPVIDADGTVIGIVTTSGSAPFDQVDVVLFKRGVLDGQASGRNGTSSLFSDTASKVASGYVVGADGNSVTLKFRRNATSGYSRTRYPIANNATEGRKWDVFTCNLDNGAFSYLVGGDNGSQAYPTLETHTIRWLTGTAQVRVLSGNPVTNAASVDQAPAEGHTMSLITSAAVYAALQNYQPAGSAITVDTALDPNSTNPVTNAAVTAALATKLGAFHYDYTVVQHMPNGSVTVNEDFATTSYNGGTTKVDGLGSTQSIISGQFISTINFSRDQVTGVFSTMDLVVTNGTALAALSPNYSPVADDFKVTCPRGQTVQFGSVYVRPGTLIIAQDRVRNLVSDESPYYAGTYVWESVNTNDPNDVIVYAYYRQTTFPTVDATVTGVVGDKILQDPDSSAEGFLLSAAGVTKALDKKVDKGTFSTYDSTTISKTMNILAAAELMGWGNLSKYTYKVIDGSVSGAMAARNVTVVWNTASRSVVSMSGGNIGAFSPIVYNYAKTGSIHCNIGSVAANFDISRATSYQKRVNPYGNSTWYKIASGISTYYSGSGAYGQIQPGTNISRSWSVEVAGAVTIWFDPTGDGTSTCPPGTLYYEVPVYKKIIDDWANTTTRYHTQQIDTCYYKASLDVDAIEDGHAIPVTSVDSEPTAGKNQALVTSGGVYDFISNKIGGNSVSLGKSGATGSFRVHGYELMDSKGHIPLARIDLGYENGTPSKVNVTGISTFGCCTYWNGKFYATEGSTAFYSGNNSTIEGQTSGYENHPLGGYIYESEDGVTWTKVQGLPQFSYVNGISTFTGCMTISGSDANGPLIVTTFNGTTWTSSTVNANGIELTSMDRIWRAAFDPDTKTLVAVGAGNSGNPNGSNNKYYVSTDGSTWQARQLFLSGAQNPAYLCGVWHLGDYWFMSSQHSGAPGNPSVLWRSANGTDWARVLTVSGGTTAGSPTTGGDHIFAMAFADGQYIVSTTYTTATGNGGIWYSKDGGTWSRATIRGSQNHVGCIIDGLVKFAGLWIGIGSQGTGVIVSHDGSEWFEVFLNGTDRIIGLPTKKSRAGRAFIINGGILYVPLESGDVAYTADGTSWAILDIGESVINEIFLGPNNAFIFVTMTDEEWSTRISKVSYSGLFNTVLAQVNVRIDQAIAQQVGNLENILNQIMGA